MYSQKLIKDFLIYSQQLYIEFIDVILAKRINHTCNWDMNLATINSYQAIDINLITIKEKIKICNYP